METSLTHEGRTEALGLEEWLASDPSIIRPGLKVIGRQVSTRSGSLDLLAIDRSENLVVIELNGDQIPRVALAQDIDYASDVASGGIDKIDEICAEDTGKAWRTCSAKRSRKPIWNASSSTKLSGLS